MVKNHKEREAAINDIINGLAGNYSATLAPETLRMWIYMLRGYSLAHIEQAAFSVIRRYGSKDVPYKSMPPFALMQAELNRLEGAVTGVENVRLQALAEWSALLNEVARCGAWRSPELNRVTAFCVRQFGGWEAVCSWRMADLNWRQKEFMEMWESACGRVEALEGGCEGVKALEQGRSPELIDAAGRLKKIGESR